MRILLISPRQCWPALTGAKLREYHLARGLGEHAQLTHVSFAEVGSNVSASGMSASDLPFCQDVISVARPSRYSPIKVARGLVDRWPLPVLNYMSAEMTRTISTLLDQQTFDLVQFDNMNMAGYLPLVKQKTAAFTVFDWHNIESELMYRYSRNATSLWRRAYARLTARRLAEVEKMTLEQASGHVVCSDRDSAELQRIAPAARIAVIGNGVDVEAFSSGDSRASNRQRIVFVGSMNYHANVEAVSLFAREVWPAIRDAFPAWRLTLVGSNPAPEVQALANERNVEVTGTVADVRPYYREAFAAIVPLRTGGGTRLKILEAMAAGVPVISTTLGAEGLTVSPGTDILIADRNESWLPHLSLLSRDPAARERLTAAARELVQRTYDWNALSRSLYDTYRRWLGAGTNDQN